MATKSLSKLKLEMTFNSDLTRLVDVMKGVSASQYFIMERKKTDTQRFTESVNKIFEMYDFRLSKHPFVCLRNPRKLIGVAATDSGFLGGLNMKVAQAAAKFETQDSHYFVLGERGASYMKEQAREHTPFGGISTDEARFQLVDQVTAYILREVLSGHFGHVLMAFPHAVNFSTQRVEVLNLIPCPLFFKDKPAATASSGEQAKKVILESSAEGIIEYLTALWLRKRLLEIFEDAKTAEFGARTMHLEGSFQTLTKIDKQLKLQFFKARREKIDQSLRETFTSQMMCGD